MLHFECDYNVGAHRRILERLIADNGNRYTAYGLDSASASASEKIRLAFGCPDAEVFFISGGTQTNQLAVDTLLDSSEGAIAARTGHINFHEAGAIEYTGHKVLEIPGVNGKIDPDTLRFYIEGFYSDANHEHMISPGMVYISHPTEYGTLYTLSELERISAICRGHGIPLYLDGARLGYGLMSRVTDVTAKDIARLTDAFYIGGTKVGTLYGEALVFTHKNTPSHFTTKIKQHGALLAKGWINGIQFDELFTDGLYFDISRHAIDMAEKLNSIFIEKEYKFFMPTETNQIFIVLENEEMERLKQSMSFGFWEKPDDAHTVVRFATSWATTEEEIEEAARLL